MSCCTVCDVGEKKPGGRCPACGRNYGRSILDVLASAQVCNFDDMLGPEELRRKTGPVKKRRTRPTTATTKEKP